MTVTEYVMAYEEIVFQMPDLPEHQYTGFFLKELKSDIKERIIERES